MVLASFRRDLDFVSKLFYKIKKELSKKGNEFMNSFFSMGGRKLAKQYWHRSKKEIESVMEMEFESERKKNARKTGSSHESECRHVSRDSRGMNVSRTRRYAEQMTKTPTLQTPLSTLSVCPLPSLIYTLHCVHSPSSSPDSTLPLSAVLCNLKSTFPFHLEIGNWRVEWKVSGVANFESSRKATWKSERNGDNSNFSVE